MRKKVKTAFDPKKFLAKVGEGKTVSSYRKDQTVFSQGEIADAVFYIQQGKVKLTVLSEQGKEAVVAIMVAFCRRVITQSSSTALVVAMRRGWPFRHPSPKK